jgi:glycosyltransferase involved in cell wall biosynthesis
MDGVATEFRRINVGVARLPLKGIGDRRFRHLAGLMDWKQRRRLATVLSDLEADVVHVNQQYDEDGLEYLLAARTACRSIVGTIHVPRCGISRKRPGATVRRWFMRWFYSRFLYPKILVSTEALNEFVSAYGAVDHCHVVPNGVPLPPTRTVSTGVSDIGAKSTVVAVVGRLVHQKRPLLALAAFKELCARRSDVGLVFMGCGPLETDLRKQIESWGLRDRVEIRGWRSGECEIWAGVEVYLACSEFEGMSLALLEAVCRGIKGVCTKAEGVMEVKGTARWLEVVDGDSVAQIADALERAIERPCPNAEEVERTRGAFSTVRMARDTVEVYHSAMRGQNCEGETEDKIRCAADG